VAEKKVDPNQVKVFYTTPTYYDYNWTVHADMPADLRQKIQDAFLALDANTPQGKEILALQRASRFVPSKPENYSGIRAAAENAGLLK
jgi:phosphonate transport system substrate-binding protein